MKLYHGTTQAIFDRILYDGAITPRGDRAGQWDDQHPSNPDAVYLTSVWGPYFAIAALLSKEVVLPPPPLVVIEVDTDHLPALVPDEDWLEQSMRPKGRMMPEQLRRRTAAARRKLPTYLGNEGWRASLDGLGTCAHLGPVPIGKGTRAALVDITKMPGFFFTGQDTVPGLQNYALHGERHRQLTEATFASCPIWEPA